MVLPLLPRGPEPRPGAARAGSSAFSVLLPSLLPTLPSCPARHYPAFSWVPKSSTRTTGVMRTPCQ